MTLSQLINEILSEWAYRIDDGMPTPKNPAHLKELSEVLDEMGLSHIKTDLVKNLLGEAEEGGFKNPALNKKINYKNAKGEDAEGIVGNLLRLPAEHPGRKAAERTLPPEGSEERDSINKDLGGEGQPTKPEEPKGKEGDKEGGADAEKEKQQQAQAMFDPKADPAMGARLEKEKEIQAQLAKGDEEETPKEEPKKEEPKEFDPVPAQDVKEEIPQADPEVFGGASDIPDGIEKEDLKDFNTNISKVKEIVDAAKAKGEKAPDINLCDITVPGTNLYCDDNLGIKRKEMPQFKGKPVPGSRAEKMPVNKDGEVDTEPVFREMLKEKGITTTQTEVAADKLKATQSELGGDKVVGMMGALEKDPNHPSITGPVFVSRDGFVIDGHHRWAAIAAYNAKYPEKQIPMKCEVIDMDIKDAIPMCNQFAEDMGIAAKKQGETTGKAGEEEPKQVSSIKPESFTDKIKAKLKKWTQSEKEYFEKGYYKAGSEPRRTVSQAIKDKAAGAWKAIKQGAKHEVEEFKTAGKGVGKFFKGEELDEHEKKALKGVAIKVATTALFGAAMGGLSYGAAGFAKHVAIEFVPHVVAETILKGAGRAAIFADGDGEAEMDANMKKFIEMIAQGLEDMEISQEQMEEMINSYEEKKAKGETEMEEPQMKEENLQLVDELMLEMIYGFIDEANQKKGESEKYPGYYHRGHGYYSKQPDGEITHKTDAGSMRKLTAKEKAEKNKNQPTTTQKPVGRKLGAGDFRQTADIPSTKAAKSATTTQKPPQDTEVKPQTPEVEENPEGQYNPNDGLQSAIVNAKNDKQFFAALDDMGMDERDLMLEEVQAGMGGPVASTGETLCCEAQTDLIQGRYDSDKIRKSKEFKNNLKNIQSIYNGSDKKKKNALLKELNTICYKMGYFDENGNPDYALAMLMYAEANTYIQQNLPIFRETTVARTKFKKEEDMVSWMKASFYSSYSLMNNGPSDWDRQPGNGRVLKANGRTDGAMKQRLLDGLKNAKTPEERAHYEKQLKIWEKFKGYHDTYLVYKNDKGFYSVYHISNKKSDALDDTQNNTTPETRLANYMASAREANLSPKSAKIVDTAQRKALQESADNDNIVKGVYSEIGEDDIELLSKTAVRLPSRSQSDLKDEYYSDLKNDKLIKEWYRKTYCAKEPNPKKFCPKAISAWKKAKPNEIVGLAINIANEIGDLSKLSGNFTKFLVKQGQLAQSIFDKAEKNKSPKEIAKDLGGKYSVKEIEAILASPLMRTLADKKAEHAAGLAGVHRGFITSLHKADGTKPGHSGKNGPAMQVYVAGTLKSLHIDTYVTNYDGNVQIEMGGVGCVPSDVRNCMKSLSGFEGEIDTPQGRELLNKHLSENVKVDADSDAVYLVGSDGKTRTYLANDTWRQAGPSKKIATGFGDNLRKCLLNEVGSRNASKRNKKK